MAKKVMIAVPSMEMVPMLFAQSLAMLEKAGPTVIMTQISSLIYTARNNLAAGAIENEADYVLWLDSDMVFPSGTLVHMMKVMEEMGEGVILTGAYFRRVAPYSPVLYEKLNFDEKGNAVWKDLMHIPDEPFEVEGCGFGCVLCPTEAFVDVSQKYRQLFDPIHGTGEDLSFCWRARQCGYRIVCDPRIHLGHYASHVITRGYWEDYSAFKEAQKNGTGQDT